MGRANRIDIIGFDDRGSIAEGVSNVACHRSSASRIVLIRIMLKTLTPANLNLWRGFFRINKIVGFARAMRLCTGSSASPVARIRASRCKRFLIELVTPKISHGNTRKSFGNRNQKQVVSTGCRIADCISGPRCPTGREEAVDAAMEC